MKRVHTQPFAMIVSYMYISPLDKQKCSVVPKLPKISNSDDELSLFSKRNGLNI